MDTRQRLIKLAEGVYVEEDTLRIAERIQEYDPNLRLKYCERSASPTDAPYRLIELCPDGIERIVFDIWELDQRVLERIYAADNKKHDINTMLDVVNGKARANEQRRYEEQKQEANEIAASIIESPKEIYKLTDPVTGKKLKIHQNAPVEVENER